MTAVGFAALYLITDLSWVFFAGLIIAYVILYYEHHLVKPHDLSKLDTAFFTMNGILSMLVFVFTLFDMVVH
ncbi:prenyltransferase [compost metagenome]